MQPSVKEKAHRAKSAPVSPSSSFGSKEPFFDEKTVPKETVPEKASASAAAATGEEVPTVRTPAKATTWEDMERCTLEQTLETLKTYLRHSEDREAEVREYR